MPDRNEFMVTAEARRIEALEMGAGYFLETNHPSGKGPDTFVISHEENRLLVEHWVNSEIRQTCLRLRSSRPKVHGDLMNGYVISPTESTVIDYTKPRTPTYTGRRAELVHFATSTVSNYSKYPLTIFGGYELTRKVQTPGDEIGLLARFFGADLEIKSGYEEYLNYLLTAMFEGEIRRLSLFDLGISGRDYYDPLFHTLLPE